MAVGFDVPVDPRAPGDVNALVGYRPQASTWRVRSARCACAIKRILVAFPVVFRQDLATRAISVAGSAVSGVGARWFIGQRKVAKREPGPDLQGCRRRQSGEDTMKKFVVLTYGYTTPTEEVQQAWGSWFALVGPHLVDPGSPFGRGIERTRTGRSDLNLESPAPLTGYCILNAESLEEAEALVQTMPIIESVRVYEASSM